MQVNVSLGQQMVHIGTQLSQIRTELGAAVSDLDNSTAMQ